MRGSCSYFGGIVYYDQQSVRGAWPYHFFPFCILCVLFFSWCLVVSNTRCERWPGCKCDKTCPPLARRPVTKPQRSPKSRSTHATEPCAVSYVVYEWCPRDKRCLGGVSACAASKWAKQVAIWPCWKEDRTG